MPMARATTCTSSPMRTGTITEFELPQIGEREWFRLVDTAQPSPHDIAEEGQEFPLMSQESYTVEALSVVIFVAK